jgi:hypothetical protein
MRDTMGQDVEAGDYLLTGGKGNGPAEYGMVMHKVISTTPEAWKLVRLGVIYNHWDDDGNRQKPATVSLKLKRSTAKKGTKYVKVNPPAQVRKLMEAGLNGTATPEQMKTIGAWLHGQTDVW